MAKTVYNLLVLGYKHLSKTLASPEKIGGVTVDIQRIIQSIDHTCLSQDATWRDIKDLCDKAAKFGVASVCIPPTYVKDAADYLAGRVACCTTVGFPNGNSTTDVKCYETENAVQNGADEIDMVINIGWLKDQRFDDISKEIELVKEACNGRILKVIIETCLLTEEEKIQICRIISDSNADFIKTSTGFSTGGATFDDIKLFREHVSSNIAIKAAGGIRTLEDAWEYILLGAARLGTSSLLDIIEKGIMGEK
jgi:deoxyribose-phosphate aldolase